MRTPDTIEYKIAKRKKIIRRMGTFTKNATGICGNAGIESFGIVNCMCTVYQEKIQEIWYNYPHS